MATLTTKKHFSSISCLRKFTPAVLAEFLLCFKPYLSAKKLDIPAPSKATFDSMPPYEAIVAACMAADIDTDLNRVLFMASQLGNKEGWRVIQEEMADRDCVAGFEPDSYTHYDLPLLTWLRRKRPENEDILEQSYARERIHAKSSYRYYAPTRDVRDKFKVPPKAKLAALQKEIALHFTGDESSPRAKVFDYDFGEEIWFLIRYPGQMVRPDAIDKLGKDEDVCYSPGHYDAVVYHKRHGDLRVNTERGSKDHERYRMTFGHALLGESNVFDPKKKIITLEPLRMACRHLFDEHDGGRFPRVQPVEICFFDSKVPGRRITWRADKSDSHLLAYGTGSDADRLLPESVDTVLYAKFRYRLSSVDGWHSMTVHQGMDLRFERDGDSELLESWLRERGFILDVFKTFRTKCAS